jgi:putative oxidoreductase
MRKLLHPRIPFALDVVLLVSRVLVGVVLLAHGLQKLNTFTPAGTEQFLASVDVPLAGIAAWWLIIAEVGGGALLIAGALTPLVALVSVVNMLGAIVFVHAGNGIFVAENGYELVTVLMAALVPLALLGAGRFSVDGVVAKPATA